MVQNISPFSVLFNALFLFCSLLTITSHSTNDQTRTDLSCLRAIKDSLEDPFDNLVWPLDGISQDTICKLVGVKCKIDENDQKIVTGLRLGGMELRGKFPLGMQSCKTLTTLDLSRNELSGPIPEDIGKVLHSVRVLDLSNNVLSGKIPSNIANCSNLVILKLNNNMLTGRIPRKISLLQHLATFNVANNLLHGPVPTFDNVNFSKEVYENNMGLCGGPLGACNKNFFDFSFKCGFMVGYVLFFVSVVTIFLSYCVPWRHIMENKKKAKPTKELIMLMTKTKKKQEEQFIRFPVTEAEQRNKNSLLEKVAARMSFKDLCTATNRFSQDNVIGSGQMGFTYKAKLSNDVVLVVKRLHYFQNLEKQFHTEIIALAKLRHRNIVPLVGYCLESRERILVYKYMSNGNLYELLHHVSGETKFLEWPVRALIAIKVAKVLAWLHNNDKFPTVHLNLSSRCILIDKNLEPKISDFRSAKLMKRDESDISMNFFIDSVFWESGIVKDVYAFGVLLLDLVQGRNSTGLTNRNVAPSFSHFYNVADKSLIGLGIDSEIFQFFRVACLCLEPFPWQRPKMSEVYEILKSFKSTNDFRIEQQHAPTQTEDIIVVADNITRE